MTVKFFLFRPLTIAPNLVATTMLVKIPEIRSKFINALR